MAQMEQKIDGLVASLVNPPTQPVTAPAPVASQPRPSSSAAICDPTRQTRSTTQREFPGSWIPVPSSFELELPRADERHINLAEGDEEADRQFISEIRNVHRFGDAEDTGGVPDRLFQPSKRREDPIKDPLVDEMMANGQADSLLIGYREMSQSFPFVPLHYATSSQELYTNKPMLLLAMMTASSWRDNKQMKALDVIYRRELAERTIIRPRRTLGLVQSVLVYLSWWVIRSMLRRCTNTSQVPLCFLPQNTTGILLTASGSRSCSRHRPSSRLPIYGAPTTPNNTETNATGTTRTTTSIPGMLLPRIYVRY
jgi:hypothetical protein